MKKILALTLAVILLALCFASCGSAESDAYSLYVNSMKNAKKGMEVKMTMKMGEIETTMDMKASETAYEISMDVLGMKSDVVYVDGIMYSSVNMGELGTQKFKQAMALKDFIAQNDAETDLPDIPEKALKDVTIEKKDGKTGFTVVLSGKEYADMLEDVVGEEIASFEDITISCEFNDDGSISLFTMKSKITVAGEAMDMEMTMEFSNIGVDPKIQAPADADSYSEMPDLGDLGDLGNLLG